MALRALRGMEKDRHEIDDRSLRLTYYYLPLSSLVKIMCGIHGHNLRTDAFRIDCGFNNHHHYLQTLLCRNDYKKNE